MKSLQEWVGGNVTVTLRSTIAISVQGILREIDETGVLLEMPRGHTFVPMTSVLHISPEQAKL